MFRLRRCLALILLAPAFVWTWGVTAHAEDKTFVSITGIAGESTDPNHTNWIDTYALDSGITVPAAGAVPSFHDVAFLKGTDKATAILHFDAARQRNLGTVILEVCRAGTNPQQCYYRVELSNATVSSLQVSGSSCVGSGGPTSPQTESVSLKYTQIKWTYTPWTGGTAGTQVVNCWNVATRQRC